MWDLMPNRSPFGERFVLSSEDLLNNHSGYRAQITCADYSYMRKTVSMSQEFSKFRVFQKYEVDCFWKQLEWWRLRPLVSWVSFACLWMIGLKRRKGMYHTLAFNCTWIRCSEFLWSNFPSHWNQLYAPALAHEVRHLYDKECRTSVNYQESFSVYTSKLRKYMIAYIVENEDNDVLRYSIAMLSHSVTVQLSQIICAVSRKYL